MHPLISYDAAKLMLDDRMRAASGARLAHEIRAPSLRRRPLRSAMGRALMALGARMVNQRWTDAPGAIPRAPTHG